MIPSAYWKALHHEVAHVKQRQGSSTVKVGPTLCLITCSVDDRGLVLVVEVERNELPLQALKRDGLPFLVLQREVWGKVPRVEAMEPGGSQRSGGKDSDQKPCAFSLNTEGNMFMRSGLAYELRPIVIHLPRVTLGCASWELLHLFGLSPYHRDILKAYGSKCKR